MEKVTMSWVTTRANARARDALRMHRHGLTYQEIADKIRRLDGRGYITRERARQMVCRAERLEANAEKRAIRGSKT